MRYPASEKLEIIRVVEQSHLPAKRTLDQLGIPRRTFYRWYDRYLEGGPEALEDRPSAPNRVWTRIGGGLRESGAPSGYARRHDSFALFPLCRTHKRAGSGGSQSFQTRGGGGKRHPFL